MSTLEARLERLEKLAGPADPPCATVQISRGGETGEDSRPRKRPAGHVCSDRCVSVSINFAHRAVSEGTRGDSPAPPLALPPPADASPPPTVPEARPDSPRAPQGLYGGAAGLGGGVPAAPASEQIVQMEPAAAPSGLVDCARAYCRHPADEHRGIRIRLPCQACGFRAEDHDPDGFAIEVPQHARRFSACSNYRAIYVDPIDSDQCEHPDCRCTGWRRWLPSDPYDPHETFAAKWAERDRKIAEAQRQLDELQARLEAAQRQALVPNDLGADPHGCPVYSDEVSR